MVNALRIIQPRDFYPSKLQSMTRWPLNYVSGFVLMAVQTMWITVYPLEDFSTLVSGTQKSVGVETTNPNTMPWRTMGCVACLAPGTARRSAGGQGQWMFTETKVWGSTQKLWLKNTTHYKQQALRTRSCVLRIFLNTHKQLLGSC